MLIKIIKDTSSFALASNPKIEASDLSPAQDGGGGGKDNNSSTSPGLILSKNTSPLAQR